MIYEYFPTNGFIWCNNKKAILDGMQINAQSHY